MSEPCIFSEDIGYIKAKLDNIDKSLNGTVNDIQCHLTENVPYRKKVDEIWAGIHFSKWIIMLIFGTGLLFNVVRYIFK